MAVEQQRLPNPPASSSRWVASTLLLLLGAMSGGLVQTAHAQMQKLTASDGGSDDYFGHAVDIHEFTVSQPFTALFQS